MSKVETAETLERLLNLVPILHANQGLPLKELLPLTGYRKPSELRARLDELMFFGVPPFSPADLIDVYIDEDDRVFLDLPQGLDRPTELTAAEWDAVRSVLEEALELRRPEGPPSELLTGLLKKLAEVPVAYEVDTPTARRQGLIEEALVESLQVRFLYRTPAAREGELRRVEPWALFHHHGSGYLIGYCHLRQDARSFHLERLEQLELLDLPREAAIPSDLEEFLQASPIFRKDASGIRVELRFRPQLRPVLEFQFGMEDVAVAEAPAVPSDSRSAAGEEDALGAGDGGADGDDRPWLRGSCRVAAPIWFRSVLRGLGPGVEVLAPAHLRADFLSDLESLPVPDLLDD